MGSKLIRLIFLFMAMVALAESFSSPLKKDSGFGLGALSHGHTTCDGTLGECVGLDNEMLMDSEWSRRQLAQGTHVSYGALKANSVPCSQRGASYYNCGQRQQVNPYNRGCTAITRCARHTT